jgi:hypothetical protein
MDQRFMVRYSATTKVRKLERLGVDRELVFLFRVDKVGADSQRQFPETLSSILVPKDASPSVEIVFSGVANLQPGDYDFWLALSDDAAKKHSIEKRRVHVAVLSDPYPGSVAPRPQRSSAGLEQRLDRERDFSSPDAATQT